MRKQNGSIGLGGIIAISFVALLFLIGGTIAVSYIKYANMGARMENTIKAEYEDMQNILGQYAPKIRDALGVTELQTDAVLKVFTGANESRYGKGGSNATFQWIKEQNPNLDQTTFVKVQQLIEAGRNKFENAQTKFIDTKRAYRTQLDYVWSGLWMSIAGYPKIDLDKYKIVKSSHATKAFETGIDDGLQLK